MMATSTARRAVTWTLRAVSSRRVAILWTLLGLAAAAVIYKSMSTAFVELEVHTTNATGVSIYWAGPGQNYSENRVTHTRIYPHKHHYKLLIGDLDKINRLRFDPLTSRGGITIREFSIYQYGYEPIRLRGIKDLSRLQPFRQIDSWQLDSGQLHVTSTTADPQLQVTLDELPVWAGGRFVGFLWRALGLVVLCVLFIRSLKWISRDYQFVPYAMLAAFTLVFVMATASRINAHPDEYVHILAARYYIDHSTPPAACAEETLHTYSPYGYSRLNSFEIAYFLTGKFARVLSFAPVTESFRLRYFNVSLFAILLILSIRSVPFRMVCLPVLASPQVWYIFSYVNSDALGLFSTLIAAHQVVSPGSTLRNVLGAVRGRRHALRLAGLGTLVAMMLLVKKNFFVADLFMGLWVVLFFFLATDRTTWIYLRRLAPAFAVALVIFGWWIYEHEAVNDFQAAERIEACADRLALDAYRRDAPVEKSLPTLYLRDKGLPFSTLFERYWGTKMFYSAFGHFGYLELLGPKVYYKTVAAILLAFIAYFVYVTLRRGTRLDKLTVLVGIGMFFLIVALTMWKAWTKDFQPQGRYFFPMVTITGMALATVRSNIRPRIVSTLFIALFVLSTYFFVFVGLLGIRKY